MSTIYLHAGTPKTGTTAIQTFCAENRKVLKEQGVCYPNLGFRFPGIGVNRNGHFLVRKETDDQKKRLYEQEDANRQKGFARIEKLLEQYPNVVLSDEQYWNNKELTTKKLKEYKEIFHQMGADTKLIVYLRRQDLLIQSYWAQQVKEGMTLSFQEYIQSGKYKYFKLDYYKRLKTFADALGKENIIIRVYEKQQYYGEKPSILADFLHIFGLELTDEYKDPERVVNTSLEGMCLELKRILNHMPVYKTKMNFLVGYLRDVQEERVGKTGYTKSKYFSRQEQADFMEQYEEGNAAIAREYLGREDGRLFYDPVLAEDTVATEHSEKEMILICGGIIEKQQKIIEEQNHQLRMLHAAAHPFQKIRSCLSRR